MYFNNYQNNDISTVMIDDPSSFGFETGGDSFLGIGKRNKIKKAEKKVRKAEKQLSKGHVKAAERKLKKGEKILSQVEKVQTGLSGDAARLKTINDTLRVKDTVNPLQTESPDTAPGQIGTAAGNTTMASDTAAQQSLGGGVGGIDTNDTGDMAVDAEGNIKDTQLPGVTVTSKKKTNMLLIAIGILAVALIVYFVIIKKRKP